jgi:hypothetical protein
VKALIIEKGYLFFLFLIPMAFRRLSPFLAYSHTLFSLKPRFPCVLASPGVGKSSWSVNCHNDKVLLDALRGYRTSLGQLPDVVVVLVPVLFGHVTSLSKPEYQTYGEMTAVRALFSLFHPKYQFEDRSDKHARGKAFMKLEYDFQVCCLNTCTCG